MQARTLFDMVLNVSSIIGQVEQAGIRLEIGDDFSEYRYLRNSQSDRSPLYPMFDVSCSYVDRSNAFWVCGFNDKDELVHTQAIRLLDLSKISLGQHLNTHRHKYITPNTTPDPDRTFYENPQALKTISGRVGYHGDFWLKASGLGGPRSQGLTTLLSRVVFELALRAWVPNYVFALVPKALALKGAHLRYGYVHCEPGCWYGPDNQVTDEDWLIWMDSKDIVNFLNSRPQCLSKEDQVPAIKSTLKSISVSG